MRVDKKALFIRKNNFINILRGNVPKSTGIILLKITVLKLQFPQYCNALSDLTDWDVIKPHLIL